LEVERQPSVSLGVQTERDQRITWLTDELALNCSLLEQAEAKAAEEKRRAISELRENEDRLLAQTSLVKQRDAELVDAQSKLRNTEAKLDESLLSFSQQVVRYAAELANVRAELEAKKSELEAVRLRLTDADDGWARSKTKAGKLHTVTAASRVDLNEDRDMCNLKEDKQEMGAELASLQWNENRIEG
jgi:chromosome segregation ATPase